MSKTSTSDSIRTRVLLVADWAVDPHAVVSTASRRDARGPARFDLVVPAWLHGADWAGDPHASFPCAQRQLEKLHELLRAAGLAVASAAVGDPDPAAAVLDALDDREADEVVLCVRDRRLSARPFDLAHRTRRLTGLPVAQVGVARSAARTRRGRRPLRRSGHCIAPAVGAARGARESVSARR